MTKNKRFMIDDVGTLIDTETRDTFDYVSDVVDLLNAFHDDNEQFKKEIDDLKQALVRCAFDNY